MSVFQKRFTRSSVSSSSVTVPPPVKNPTTKRSTSKSKNPLVNQPGRPGSPLQVQEQSKAAVEMVNQTDNVAEQLGIDLNSLSGENKNLAVIIIQGITALMNQKFEEERRKTQDLIENLERKLVLYEEKLDDMECYGRRNTIVISGPDVPTATSDENSIEVSCQIIAAKLEVPIAPEDICVAHRLGTRKPGGPDKRNLIVKFVRRSKKHDIYKACGVKRPQGVYFSDSVSKTRHTIMYALRKAKQRDSTKFGKVRTRDGNIRLELPNSDDSRTSKVVVVNTRRKLDELLRTRMGFDSSEFDCRW